MNAGEQKDFRWKEWMEAEGYFFAPIFVYPMKACGAGVGGDA